MNEHMTRSANSSGHAIFRFHFYGAAEAMMPQAALKMLVLVCCNRERVRQELDSTASAIPAARPSPRSTKAATDTTTARTRREYRQPRHVTRPFSASALRPINIRTVLPNHRLLAMPPLDKAGRRRNGQRRRKTPVESKYHAFAVDASTQ